MSVTLIWAEAAGRIIGQFAGKYHVPPAFDIIVDNPIETRQDVIDTLELLYKMPRPYTLLIYSLNVIPNTELERAITERGVELDGISSSFLTVPFRAANILFYLLATWKPPRWLFDKMLTWVRASNEDQKMYERTGATVKTIYLARRGYNQLKFMDFSVLPGRLAWVLSKLGVVKTCQQAFIKKYPKPAEKTY